MQQVKFEHFIIETKEKLANYPELVRHLNPYCDFYKSGETYLALMFAPKANTLTVHTAIGKGKTFNHELWDLCKKNQIQYVEFITNETNKATKSIADYWGFKNVGIEPDFYGPGTTGLLYRIDLLDPTNSRLTDKKG